MNRKAPPRSGESRPASCRRRSAQSITPSGSRAPWPAAPVDARAATSPEPRTSGETGPAAARPSRPEVSVRVRAGTPQEVRRDPRFVEGSCHSVFRAKACPGLDPGWRPVRVKKTRQNKILNPGSDAIRTDQALTLGRHHHQAAHRDIGPHYGPRLLAMRELKTGGLRPPHARKRRRGHSAIPRRG